MSLDNKAAQQKVEEYQASMKGLLGVVDAIKNPEPLRALLKEVADANVISEKRKNEVKEAEATIAKASASMSALLKEQDAFNKHVEVVEQDFDKQKKSLLQDRASFETEKAIHNADVAKKLDAAKQLVANAEALKKENALASESLTVREKNLITETASAKAREDSYAERVKSLDEREKALLARETQLRAVLG